MNRRIRKIKILGKDVVLYVHLKNTFHIISQNAEIKMHLLATHSSPQSPVISIFSYHNTSAHIFVFLELMFDKI